MFDDITDLSEQIEAFLNASASQTSDSSEESTPKSQRKEVKGTYFGVILYPEEDNNHKSFFNYITSRPSYDYVWILHDRDDSKPHIHMMIHTLDRMAVGSFVKFFTPWISYAECISFPKSYISYMLHDTPSALVEGKAPYSVSQLHGSEKLWRHLIQNSHFVQLEEILSYHNDGGTFLDTYKNIPKERKPALGDYMSKYAHFVRSCISDENQKYYKWLEYARCGFPYTKSNKNEESE